MAMCCIMMHGDEGQRLVGYNGAKGRSALFLSADGPPTVSLSAPCCGSRKLAERRGRISVNEKADGETELD